MTVDTLSTPVRTDQYVCPMVLGPQPVVFGLDRAPPLVQLLEKMLATVGPFGMIRHRNNTGSCVQIISANKKQMRFRSASTASTANEDTIRQVLQWQRTIVNLLRSQQVLNTTQLLELAGFLDNLALWCQRMVETNIELCVFCRNNNAPFETYTTHKVKDRFGRVTCPILRQFSCPVCGATGDQAHTIRYCPFMSNGSVARASNAHRATNPTAPTNMAFGCMRTRLSQSNTSTGPSMQLIEAGLLSPEAFSV